MEKIFILSWLAIGLILIIPFSIFVVLRFELERVRFVKQMIEGPRDQFLALMVPPHSWRLARQMDGVINRRLGDSLFVFVMLWFVFPFALVPDQSKLDRSDWIELIFLLLLVAWMFRLLILAYRRRELLLIFRPKLTFNLPISYVDGSDQTSTPTLKEVAHAVMNIGLFSMVSCALAASLFVILDKKVFWFR